GFQPYWLTYDFPPQVKEKLKHQWGSDWKGQDRSGFFLNSLGRMKKSICWVMGPEKAEFSKWSWISPEQIVELMGRLYLFYFSLLVQKRLELVFWSCWFTYIVFFPFCAALDFNKHVYKEVMTVFAPHL
ncbi:nudix hydrolase 26, partial [Quercus suber]